MSTIPEHPLETVFGLDAGTTFSEEVVNTLSTRPSELVDPTTGKVVSRSSEAQPDELEKEERLEDLHIDGQLDVIHSTALQAYEKQTRLIEEVDPKFAARNAEVAAQYLTLALNAVNSRVDAKYKRQKVRLAKATSNAPGTVNNNVIVADRNQLLKLMQEAKEVKGETIFAGDEVATQ